jgi:hypothetical protein
MTYHNVGIHHISPSQKAKLKRGCGVRLHLGSHHQMPLRADQVKKLHTAHKKGSASTVTLDPYQIDMLHGSGFFDSLKSVARAIAPVVRPIATNALKGVASSMLGPIGSQVAHGLIDIGDQQAAAHGYGIKKRAGRPRKHYVHHDKRIGPMGHLIEPAMHKKTRGKGMFGDLLKGASKALRPVATNLLQSQLAARGGPLTQALGGVALQALNNAAESHGYGLHKKRRGRPRKHMGGALIAAGY